MFKQIKLEKQRPNIFWFIIPSIIVILTFIGLYPFLPFNLYWSESFENVISVNQNGTWEVVYDWFKNKYYEKTLILPSIWTSMPVWNWYSMDKMDNGYATMIFPERNLWEPWNVVITWHRYLIHKFDKKNFLYYISDIEIWDLVYVYWNWYLYTYRVINTEIVPPTQISVHANTKEPILTIYSCHPLNSSASRFVVTSKFVGKSAVN